MSDIEAQYNKALDYLYSFVDYSLKHSSELAKAEFNLDRMYALMDALGNPQTKYPIIHVAGTKGKGSVSALCASALKAEGYHVGLYSSPHLLEYTERIQVYGEPISFAQLVDLVEQVKPAVAKIPKLTTFEITTAIGFLAFARQYVDAAVIEVGLGGRLDATNVVTRNVSVITSLSSIHEVGHFLDNSGTKPLWSSQSEIENDRIVAIAKKSNWWTGFEQPVNYFGKAKDMPIRLDRKWLNYLRTPKEILARAYAQFIATESDDPILLAQLKKLQEQEFPTQWNDKDFEPIAEEFRKLFKERSWMP